MSDPTFGYLIEDVFLEIVSNFEEKRAESLQYAQNQQSDEAYFSNMQSWLETVLLALARESYDIALSDCAKDFEVDLPSVEALEKLRVENSEKMALRYPDEEEIPF